MKKRRLLIAAIALVLAGSVSAAAYGQKKPKITKVKPDPAPKKKSDTTQAAEPDKILYDRALLAIKHGRFTEGRLDYQTLINTYPDSEYLAKAKLGVADSFYKEGGTSSLTQAVEEYKNFIVFFPFLDEAAYAQMQVGMANYKLMEKADRDNSHAEAAEDEFRAFLVKYPQSQYVPQAEQSMRNVQEVLAEGEFGIARFYYFKKDYRASAARLVEVTGRYPLFSQSDEALWMLGDVYQRAKQLSKNEDDKNHWADLAAKCYDRIVSDYPASSLVSGAKEHLKAMNMPIPAPSPDALKRMREQQMYQKQHHQLAVMKLPMDMVKAGPDVSAAAHSGVPNLAPPDETVSAMEVLNQGAAGPSFTVVAAGGGAAAGGVGGGSNTADSESVETETPEASSTLPAAVTTATTSANPGDSATVPAQPTATVTSSRATASTAVDPATTSTSATSAVSSAAAAQDATPATTASQTGTATPQANGAPAVADKADPNTESSSKKKKGLHKLIPF